MTSPSQVTLLPSEIQLQILGHLPRVDRSHMPRVCRSLHEVAVTALYEVIQLEGDEKSGESPSFHLLLDLFLRHPERGFVVRNVLFLGPRRDIFM